MFTGEFQRPLDEKGRVILPVKFREQLGTGAWLTKQIDGCLAIWTAEEYAVESEDKKRLLKATSREDRAAARSFLAGAVPAEPDRQGRIAIPPHLREFARIERDVVLTGAHSVIEIWSGEQWQRENETGERRLAEGLGGAD
jgi:MraZ protein